jgi:hypothetical protein
MVLVWLKNLNYLHAQTAHSATLESDEEGVAARYKASFQIHRRISAALDQQAQVVFRFLMPEHAPLPLTHVHIILTLLNPTIRRPCPTPMPHALWPNS